MIVIDGDGALANSCSFKPGAVGSPILSSCLLNYKIQGSYLMLVER
jgi:hypothetical protein